MGARAEGYGMGDTTNIPGTAEQQGVTDAIRQLKQWIDGSSHLVFFGGAGVSTESGIPDFRGKDGLYSRGGIKVGSMTVGCNASSEDASHDVGNNIGNDVGSNAGNDALVDPEFESWGRMEMESDITLEEIFSLDIFEDFPEAYYTYFRNSHHLGEAKPNVTHRKLAQWEREGKLKAVITQNIDGLHQAAGSENVFELHGNETRFYCSDCGHAYTLDEIEASASMVPLCACGGTIRPDIVFYGEGLNMDVFYRALAALAAADVLIVAGSSLVVYPAAGLLDYYTGHKMVIINDMPTPYDGRADLVIHSRIGEVFSQL